MLVAHLGVASGVSVVVKAGEAQIAIHVPMRVVGFWITQTRSAVGLVFQIQNQVVEIVRNPGIHQTENSVESKP